MVYLQAYRLMFRWTLSVRLKVLKTLILRALVMPSSTTSLIRKTLNTALKPKPLKGCSLRVKSMAQRGTKKLVRRACLPVPMPPLEPKNKTVGAPSGIKLILVCWLMTLSPWAQKSPTACLPAARNTACYCAKTMPISV